MLVLLGAERDQQADALVVQRADQGGEPGGPGRARGQLGEVAQPGLGLQRGRDRPAPLPQHHADQPPALQRDAERLGAQRRLGDGQGVGEDAGEQGAVGLPLQGLPVAHHQPVERQRGRAALQQHGVRVGLALGQWAGLLDQDEPAPVLAAGADDGDQPAAARVVPGTAVRPHPARAALPVLQHLGLRAPGGVVGQHLVGQVLQDDRRARHPGHLADHLRWLGALHHQLVEHLVDGLGDAQLLQLGVDHQGVHGLGDGDEAQLAAERDQRQPALLGGVHQGAGERVEVAPPELDDQAGHPDVVQFADVAGQALAVLGQRDAGGQHQLAAAEHPGDVRQLADVDPADRPLQVVGAGHDLGQAAPHHLQVEYAGDGGEHRGASRVVGDQSVR